MLLLAIDPGYDKVGYSIFKDDISTSGRVKFVFSSIIRTSRIDLHEKRLLEIFNSLQKVINTHKIDTIVIESLFYFKNKKTVMKVSQAFGVILLLAAKNNLPITQLTPLQIKQIITGYGQADKKSVEKMIRLELGETIHIEDDDESDAIACGLAYCFINNKREIF